MARSLFPSRSTMSARKIIPILRILSVLLAE